MFDEDGDNIIWSIEESNIFQINSETGKITLLDEVILNYEQVNTYQITVIISDWENLSSEKDFTVNVIDLNDPPVMIDTISYSISEDAVINTSFTPIVVFDEDEDTLEFSIDPPSSYWSVASVNNQMVISLK